ncbi:MAG: head-tail connector protein [Nocardioidaceae bacterium]
MEDLKADLEISDDRDDAELQTQLDAAVGYVQRVRPDVDYTASDPDLPVGVTNDLVLGTVRLAGRWYIRRRSPAGLVDLGEFGSTRVPSFDPDIEKLLGLGRFHKAVSA